MDLELHEALAFGEDRGHAVAQLLPGSEEHDYHRCLHAQHAGQLDEAQRLLDAWPGRHGSTAGLARLRARQLLYRATQPGPLPAEVRDRLRDHYGAALDHEAEVEEADPTRPTRLPASAFDARQILREAVAYDSGAFRGAAAELLSG